jgi:hypothetical protein
MKSISKELGYRDSLIIKGISKDIFKCAERPCNTVLSNHKIRKLLNTKINGLHEVLSGSEFDKYREKEIRKI